MVMDLELKISNYLALSSRLRDEMTCSIET